MFQNEETQLCSYSHPEFPFGMYFFLSRTGWTKKNKFCVQKKPPPANVNIYLEPENFWKLKCFKLMSFAGAVTQKHKSDYRWGNPRRGRASSQDLTWLGVTSNENKLSGPRNDNWEKLRSSSPIRANIVKNPLLAMHQCHAQTGLLCLLSPRARWRHSLMHYCGDHRTDTRF